MIDREIVTENELVAREAYERGDYVLGFLLAHSLVESLLRAFLTKTGKESFSELVQSYGKKLKGEGQSALTFVAELTAFNKRRNRVVHDLWRRGYPSTNNRTLDTACRGAFMMYGLLIEWLETFEPEITASGFEYE